jgi:hypothetical protein
MWPSCILPSGDNHVIRGQRPAHQDGLHVGEGVPRDVRHQVDDTARCVRRDNDLIEPEQRIVRIRRLNRKHVKPCAVQLATDQRVIQRRLVDDAAALMMTAPVFMRAIVSAPIRPLVAGVSGT